MSHRRDVLEQRYLTEGIVLGAYAFYEDGGEVDLTIPPGGYPPGEGPFGDLPPGFVAPGAVPPRPEKWDLEAQPFALLTITSGDTLVGLAKTYLGDGARYLEIWNTGRTRAILSSAAIAAGMPPGPDIIMTTGPIDMPEEARDNMVNWLNKGQPPGSLPGNTPPETLVEQGKRMWPWVLGGTVLAGVAVAGAYAASK